MAKERTRKGLLLIIFITVFLNLLGVGIVIPVLAPLFLSKAEPFLPLHYSFGDRTLLLGILVASYPIAQFFGAPLLGALSDHHGRKRILLLALVGSMAGYALFAIGIHQQNLWMLFVGRIIDGITGGNIAVINSAIADISDNKSKSRNFGLVGMAFGMGFIIGPFLGGVLSDPLIVWWFNFATPFWFATALLAANCLLVVWLFPETLKEPVKKRLRIFMGIRNLRNALQLVGVQKLLWIVFLATFGFTFFTQFFQVFLFEKFSYRQSDIGELFAYIGIWIALTQGGVLRLVSKFFKPVHILRVSTLGLSIVFILLLLPSNDKLLYFILPFMSLFQGMNQPNLLAMISNRIPPGKQGEIMGVNQSLQSVALAIPPIIGGLIVSLNINLPIIMASFCLFVAWLVLLKVDSANER
ncbi:MAG: MFS transporter [Bacteroidia bacterium]